MKRSASLIFTSLLALGSLAAEKYRIYQVNYDITGITKPYALERNIEIDKKRILRLFILFVNLHKGTVINNIKTISDKNQLAPLKSKLYFSNGNQACNKEAFTKNLVIKSKLIPLALNFKGIIKNKQIQCKG